MPGLKLTGWKLGKARKNELEKKPNSRLS